MAAIDTYAVTSSTAKALRALNKDGMNLADFAALTTTSSFTGFGNGTGYTVTNWVSDGVFASVAAAQAVYPIIQDGNDHVDWVLLQSAVDFLIYGALGSSNRQNMKRKLIVPAGWYLINRTLNVGYARMGTPPADLNANGYINITIEGEGRPADPTGNGMTGTTIFTEGYGYPGIVVSKFQTARLKGFALQGPGLSWMQNNMPLRDGDSWDRAQWRDPAITDDEHWIGGDRVNIGIGFDLYTGTAAAAAYPARILPASFGGGTTTATSGTAGGTTCEIDDVSVTGFVIGIGRPHGDNNGEFLRVHNSDISWCPHAWVVGASQARNNALVNVNIESCHTAITNIGGTQGNANHHGTYQNIHFGRCFQLIDHDNADWSGPLTLRDCYAESFFRIGSWESGRVKLDGCYLSFLEQEATDGVPFNHFNIGHLTLDNTTLTGLRHGLMSGAVDPTDNRKVEMLNGSSISYGSNANYAGHANAADIAIGIKYIRGLFHRTGRNARRFHSDSDFSQDGYDNNWHNNAAFSFLDQKDANYYASYPMGGYPIGGSDEMVGSVQSFPVPKFSKVQRSVTVASRSGFDLTCTRTQVGDVKADVGDVFMIYPAADASKARYWTHFIVVSISGANMVLRQLSNFDSTNSTNYVDNGHAQVGAGSFSAEYICCRVRQNRILFVGDVTSGSAVISNVRYAFQLGTTDQFTLANFDMVAGDYFLHQEIERSVSGGGVRVHNLVSSIDFAANTITLTQTFNITRTAYPIVFYVRQFNA
jgi:hypothetical protein